MIISRLFHLKNLILSQEKGQSLVEFALVLPMLILLTLGTADFCRIAYAATVVHTAAQAGARAGMIDRNVNGSISQANIEAAVTNNFIGLDASQVVVAPVVDANPVRVSLSYQVDFILLTMADGLFPGALDTTSFNLTSTASMVAEN